MDRLTTIFALVKSLGLEYTVLRRRGRIAAALVALSLLLAGGAMAATPKPSGFERVLTKIVAQLMATQHYTHDPLDDGVSSQLFEEFFKSLDPERRFFLASDIEDFALFRYQLDDHLQDGRVDFAYSVYQRFLQRVKERVDYAEKRLNEPFDFTLDENIRLDRSDEPWAKTTEELDELWRRHLKNRVLVFSLLEETAGDETEQDEAAAAEDDEAEKAASADHADVSEPEPEAESVTVETPQEKALKAQTRYLTLIEGYESLDILELYLGSLARIYDPHSTYMAPATEEDFDINMSLSLQGIGAVLTTQDGYVKIVDIIPGGPADNDGSLKAGDRITAVAQAEEEPVDVINMPLRKVVRMIRGPKGSNVVLTVIEAGKSLSSMPSKISLMRDEVKLTEREAKSELRDIELPINVQKEDSDDTHGGAEKRQVMVISLPSFYADFSGKRDGKQDYKSATRDVKKLLENAEADDIDGIILDLRGNGGGSLEEAVKLAGLFFERGPVVQVRSSGSKTEVYNDPDSDMPYSGALVVLVDRLSASASEIVAACIQDYKRAVVVGESSTHGKGTVQTVIDLNRFFARHPIYKERETGALKFTIAKFYRINGHSTQRRGVIPDIQLSSFHDNMKLGEDKLEHALPWDEIEALDVKSDIDVEPYLPILKQRSAERLAQNEEYQERLALIEEFAKLQDRKALTLNKEQRLALQKEEEVLMNRVRKENVRGRNRHGNPSSENAEEEGENEGEQDADEAYSDIMMKEALNVMSDLIWLYEGQLIANPDADGDNEPESNQGRRAVTADTD